jgi:hypothetical protein
VKVDFFEEYADLANLRKAELVGFDSTVYLAARSLPEFRSAAQRLHDVNPRLRPAFWPVLRKSYWVSPFSYPRELVALFEEILLASREMQLEVLLDLEIPLLQTSLFLRNLMHFLRNKRAIRTFLRRRGNGALAVTTAEYPGFCQPMRWCYEFSGISYPTGASLHRRMVLFYSSMVKRRWMDALFRSYIAKELARTDRTIQVGVGAIASGAFGDEPVLSPAELDRDMAFLKANGTARVAVFRLGGLNKEYINLLNQYV